MKLYSTNDTSLRVDFETAVFQALPKDRGLYMPVDLKPLPAEFWSELPGLTIADIGLAVSRHLLQGAIPDDRLEVLVREAINFPSPLVELRLSPKPVADQHVLELWHGPSLAFKDFGARFMAGVMNEMLKLKDQRLLILVATSGDTGGAVAAGFYGSSNIDVLILYPKGKVSDVQEAQLTTLGGNVSALRVDGTFDDCQDLVKQAFVDSQLRDSVNISSANSINISRLIPQTFYYIDAYRQWLASGRKEAPVFCVPSGNFGNLTAGLLAARMGMPVHRFVAATNANDTVTRYANTGTYQPKPSVRTISNAMDVGAPSNFSRMQDLFGSTWNTFKEHIYAASFTDEDTAVKIKEIYQASTAMDGGYVLDPHTAVGLLALEQYQREVEPRAGIVLGTAHAGKFLPDVERILEKKIDLPAALQSLADKPRRLTDIQVEYATLREEVIATWHRNHAVS